jgi:hypothetical protein
LAAKVTEMQSRIQELEFDVSRTEDLESRIETLKNDIQLRDWTIEARDKDLVLARKQAEEARVQATENEKTLDRVLTSLTEANERKAALTAWVAEMETEKDSLVAEKLAFVEKQKEARARCKKLRKKIHHYKSNSKRLKKQLDLVPWLRGLSWGQGSNWGFESLRTMLLHPEIFEVDPETVTPDLIEMPENATNELQTLGVEFFSDVTDWTEDAPNPYRDDLISGPSISDCTPRNEDVMEVEAGDEVDSPGSPNV